MGKYWCPQGKSISGYLVDGLFMLDDNTCCLSFKEVEVGGNMIGIDVEYWLDDCTWHFTSNVYDKDGNFLRWYKFYGFSDEEKEECKELVFDFLAGLNR